MEERKHCDGCNRDLPRSAFIPKGKGPTGTIYRTRLCRDCHNTSRRADPRERERYNQWRETNKEWWNEYMRQWRADNPGYDTRSRYMVGKLRIKAEELQGDCVYCGEPASEVDHFIPRSLGGSDDLDNLVSCCRSCNASKNAIHPSEWGPSKPLWRTLSNTGKLPSMVLLGTTRGKQGNRAAATTEREGTRESGWCDSLIS